MTSTSSAVMSPRTISILAAGFFTSRGEAFDQPITVSLSRVTEAIVQTIGPSLPEFDYFGFYAISAPVWRQRNGLAAKPFCHLRHARVQYAASIEHLALTRCPRAQLAADWARTKISL